MTNTAFFASVKTFLLFGSLFVSLKFFSACNNLNSENLPTVKSSPTLEIVYQSNDNRKENVNNPIENDYIRQKADFNKQIADSRNDELIKKIDEATERKNYQELNKILESKPNLNVRTREGNSLLVLMMPDIRAFEMLLKAGADPNFPSLKVGCAKFERCLKPPTYIAFEKDNLAALRLLLKYNADPNAESVLAWAVSRGNDDAVKLLIAHKANVNFSEAVGEAGQTPIFFAENAKLAKTLLKNGAMLNHRDKNGRTPIMLAIENENLEMVRFFIKHGADVNLKDKMGASPLQQSLAIGNKNIIKELKLAGAK